ncbi:hypothetical protein KW800_00785 [Candidatus Parcubacteria bacterium]|nr:hypothetical protein [Candidatus Parcubacteria bacterium]
MNNPFKKWGYSPQADWQIMFSIFLILLVLAIVGSIAMFSLVQVKPLPQDDIATEVLSKNALHRAALYYDEKRAAFDRVKAVPETTPDPSK